MAVPVQAASSHHRGSCLWLLGPSPKEPWLGLRPGQPADHRERICVCKTGPPVHVVKALLLI